ncbi:MAG: sensory box histidine kinase [Bacteriovoracaceae bacterium]|nr:sensory box histidine kinase [Bacteriovoracaceae bacterium]
MLPQIELELQKDFLARSRSASIGAIILSVLYAFINSSGPKDLAWSSCSLISILAIFRIYFFLRVDRSLPQSSFYYLSIGTALIQAIIWGLWCGRSLHWNKPSLDSIFSLFVLSGIAASVSASIITSAWARATYLVFLLGIPIIESWPEGKTPLSFLGIIGITLSYGSFLFAQGTRHGKRLRESLTTNHFLVSERDLLRTLFDTIPGKVTLISSELCYEDVNGEFLSFLGLTRDQLIGRKVGFLEGDQEIVSVIQKFSKIESSDLRTELKIKTPTGERWHLVMMKKTEVNSAIVVITIDIHEKREGELKVAESELLAERASKFAVLGELSAGIAHELKNPLAVIHALAQSIEMQLEKKPLDASKLKNYAEQIFGTTQRIAKTIDGMRAFAREEKLPEKIPFNVRDLIQESVVLCDHAIAETHIELLIADCPSVEIICSPNQVSQILLNLLSNAIYACEQSKIANKWISINAEIVENKCIEISITDSGLGIPKEIRDRIMQPFFTTKPVGSGTGIGLTLSRNLAEAHGGKIYLDSSCPNTKFVLKLPIHRDLREPTIRKKA